MPNFSSVTSKLLIASRISLFQVEEKEDKEALERITTALTLLAITKARIETRITLTKLMNSDSAGLKGGTYHG